MEKVRIQLVNTSPAGVEEHLAFQDPTTLRIFQFEDIKYVSQNTNSRPFNPEEDWKYVLNHMGHFCEIDQDEDGDFTIYLI